ncbi:MAG: biotin--[acetyl-CoA-carboxylase] ligase [Spirochaetia bacterium]|jgi:BirA family biotin operon repressor/biotin-[acetyl-CoA-carboxylase] ligase|nr:biotin--[acetyl-CoA-carboxylase] ligase [Spirochaetia bacterium]
MQKLNIDNPFSSMPGTTPGNQPCRSGKAEIYHKEITDSTMNDARELILFNPPTGTLVVSSEQTAGRGRVKGRKWISAKEESLMFTMLIKNDDLKFPATFLPLFAGFAVSGFLESEYGIKSKIKWPNDVLVERRKISGILCENSSGYILCGIGLNCGSFAEKEIAGNSIASIGEITGVKPDILQTLTGLLLFMQENWSSNTWQAALEEKLYMRGENVLLCDGLPESGKRIEGIIIGLGEDGELVIMEKSTGKRRHVYSGEILCK